MSATLSAVLKDANNGRFIRDDTITLSYKHIALLDDFPARLRNIEHLHLSHNSIRSLEALEQLPNLKSLSLTHNLIEDWQELLHIPHRASLTFLRVRQNPLTCNPSYQHNIIQHFINLKNLDDLMIDYNVKRLVLLSNNIVSRHLVQFLYYIHDELQVAERVLNQLRVVREISSKSGQPHQLQALKQLLAQLDQESMYKLKILLNEFTQHYKSQNHLILTHFIYTVMESLMDKYVAEKRIDDRLAFNQVYQELFRSLMVRYNGNHDKSLEAYLTQRCRANPEIDLE